MRAHVTPGTREVLAALPFRIDLRPRGGHLAGPAVILLHGAPTLNTLYWTEDRSDDFCRQMARRAGAQPGDVLAFGHTHRPWHRVVDGIHLLNAGSVGRPKDGDWRACYAVLEVGDGDPTTTVRRVEYDLDSAMEGIRSAGLPDDFAEHLRTGGRA
jgi:diadenosine tetraphosphatase ApaH/serine/threonine PP2A family protein phosphatase